MASLVLISCSDKKKEGGAPYRAGADPFPWLKNNELRRRLSDTRTKVLDLIKANALVDSEKRQGNRARDPRNAGLVEGPEFGGKEAGGAYLPACLRYTGRFFRTIRGISSEEELLSRWQGVREDCPVLIVSGLYGLVAPFDPIQEYTCHFADRISGHEMSLQQLWGDLLTDIVLSQVDKRKDHIVDLMSEEAYEEAFDWARIYKDIRCLHRAYKLKAGPETLINSALFFKDQFLNQQEAEPALFPDKFIAKEYFDDPQERILFETELKMTGKEVAREGILEVLPELKRRYGSIWDSLSIAIRGQIANSEYSYLRNRDLNEFDFTSASICLSKAIEKWLEEFIIVPLLTIPRLSPLLSNSRGPIPARKATIGNACYFLEKIVKRGWLNEVEKLSPSIRASDIEELTNELRMVASNYRNGWVHKDPMSRKVYEEFRIKAYEFLIKWVPKWKIGREG